MAALAAGGAAGTGGTGSTTVSPLPAWGQIYGSVFASSAGAAVSGVGAPISIATTNSGSGVLGYTLNGAWAPYGGPFTAHNGDSLAWTISAATSQAGNIVVTNVTAGQTLATIKYSVTGFTGGFYP